MERRKSGGERRKGEVGRKGFLGRKRNGMRKKVEKSRGNLD